MYSQYILPLLPHHHQCTMLYTKKHGDKTDNSLPEKWVYITLLWSWPCLHTPTGANCNTPQLEQTATHHSWSKLQHTTVGANSNTPQLEQTATHHSWSKQQHTIVGANCSLQQFEQTAAAAPVWHAPLEQTAQHPVTVHGLSFIFRLTACWKSFRNWRTGWWNKAKRWLHKAKCWQHKAKCSLHKAKHWQHKAKCWQHKDNTKLSADSTRTTQS